MCSLKVNLLAAKYPIKKVDCAINNQLKSKFTTGKQFLTSWRGLTTEDINANVGGAIIADKLAYIFHLTPEQQNLSKLKSTIEQKAGELILTGNKLWGFICGGWALDKNNDISKRSFDIYNTLADIMDNLNIPFGMVCGKQAGNHYDNFRLKDNNIYVWSDLIKNRFEGKDVNSPDEIIDNLEQDYQFVEFNPEIELYCPKFKQIEEPGTYTDILV